MKVPPPRSLNLAASQALLALSALGGGGAVAATISSSNTSTATASSEEADSAATNAAATAAAHDGTAAMTTTTAMTTSTTTTTTLPLSLQSRKWMTIISMPRISQPQPQHAMTASPMILATSDAAADRSASMAAELRWKKQQPQSPPQPPTTPQFKPMSDRGKNDSNGTTTNNNHNNNGNAIISESFFENMPLERNMSFNYKTNRNAEIYKNRSQAQSKEASSSGQTSNSGRHCNSNSNIHNNTSNATNGPSSTTQQQSTSSTSSKSKSIKPPPSPPTATSLESYPAFTPYHNSLLKKYLTPPLWHALHSLTTPTFHTSIEDVIRPGLSLPLGANPPRRVGVLAGDAECYTVFRELLDPIIWEYHGIESEEGWEDPELPREGYFEDRYDHRKGRSNGDGSGGSSIGEGGSNGGYDDHGDGNNNGVIKSNSHADGAASYGMNEEEDEDDYLFDEENDKELALSSSSLSPSSSENIDNASSSSSTLPLQQPRPNLRRHCTIINNPLLVTKRKADPEGKYIVSTRIRVARSLDGMRFPTTMSRSDRRKVQRLIEECTQNFQSPHLSHGTYLPVLSMTNDQNLDLIERHILFDNPNEWTIAAGLGRDWPDGRALYANVPNVQTQTPDFMIWVNEEDHLRIMCLRNGGDIQGVFTTLMNGVRELERELRKRSWHFAQDGRLGYLTSCPTNIGTTMRASVHVKLDNLGRLPGFLELVERLKLEVRGKYGETDRQNTGVFDISNSERLGKSEVHLINVMVEGVAKLIELERRLETGEVVNCDEIARD